MQNRGEPNTLGSPANGFAYDAFATHATDPDGALVRAVEARIETFHTRYGVTASYKRELELCVDGRDFVFSRRDRSSETGGDIIEPVVRSYQRKSRALIVFSGPSSRNHPWIGKEVDWWGVDRPGGPVYFALTHGADPGDAASNMPQSLSSRGGGDTPVFFDLRSYYRRRRTLWQYLTEVEGERTRELREEARSWASVRDFDEEVGKLAARLTCDAVGGDASLGEIENSYVAAIRRERFWRRGQYALAGLIVMVAVGLAGQWGANAFEGQRRARVSTWIQQAEALGDVSGPNLVEGLAYASSAVEDGTDPRASRVLHRIMRRLAPIERTFTEVAPVRRSEQTQTATLTTDGRFLVTGGRDSVLHMIELVSGRRSAEISLDAGRIRTIAPMEDGSALVVGTDRGVRYIRIEKGADGGFSLHSVAAALTTERIGGLALDRVRGQAVVGTFSGKIFTMPVGAVDDIWSPTPLMTILDPRYVAKGENEVVSGIFGVQARGDRLVVAGIDGVLTVFDWRDGRPEQSWQLVHPHSIFALDVSSDGATIAVADDEGRLSIYDAKSGKSREAQLRTMDPASLAKSLRGDWIWARPDELPSVGVSFDPTGTVLAVSSHDRTVKFLLVRDLSLLSIAVHGAATRGVVFDQKTGFAYTFGDDGVIHVVRPQERPLVAEIAGIENVLVPSRGRPTIIWPTAGSGSTPLFSLRLDQPFSSPQLSTVSERIWGGYAAENGRLFLRAGASSKVHVAAPEGGSPCAVSTLDHPNEPGNVANVRALHPGTEAGEVVTVAEQGDGSKHSVVRGWNTVTCRMVWQVAVNATADRVSMAAGTIIERDASKRVTVRTPPKPDIVAAIEFDHDVTAAAALSAGRNILVQTTAKLCLCSPGTYGKTVTSQECGALSKSYLCKPVSPLPAGQPPPIRKLFASPTGKFAVATGGSAEVWLINVEGLQVRQVAPSQLRPIEAPFAFNADETLLAVPAGDTGLRIMEASTGNIVAELPTPSRVMRLAFTSDGTNRLLSVDAGLLRVWDWSRKALLREACKRWPPHLAVANATPRPRICGAEPLEKG
jgi:WD40 repeat protein